MAVKCCNITDGNLHSNVELYLIVEYFILGFREKLNTHVLSEFRDITTLMKVHRIIETEECSCEFNELSAAVLSQ